MLLVFARTRLVRDLTKHDFYGSRPEATIRIRIIATSYPLPSDHPQRLEHRVLGISVEPSLKLSEQLSRYGRNIPDAGHRQE